MTDSDLRELDGWIAEHLFGKTICPGEYDHILTEDNLVLLASNYSSDPAAFSLVKREIERRGWSWSLDFYPATDGHYQFRLHSVGMEYPDVDIWASSEELAGCLAVKAAVEGTSE